MTKKSCFGTRRANLKVAHSKVPITTINMTPTNAASGIISIKEAVNRIKHSSNTAATIPDRRPRPPELTLIIDCPIMAQPPMAPNMEHVILAKPCPIHSRLDWPRVPVISSKTVSVSSDSIKPIAARIKA
ncbi:Uncharacterised protein [Vibrio cholerae]|nr:Uncharacterised protein [Vibrio cholerae]CSB57687.1 Uncharacterised protein [Vibrio cholerae]CSD10744.1 Uncharacterised protein [Vibrio cholerae]